MRTPTPLVGSLRDYMVRRLLLQSVVLIGFLALTFTITSIVPGDPFIAKYGAHVNPLSEEALQKLREEWGLTKPKHEQFFIWLSNLVRGNLGNSAYSNRAVFEDLVQYFPATMELATLALIFSITLGIPIGVVSATRRNKVSDHVSRLFALTGVSMPIFWLGLVLLYVFYLQLGFGGPGRIDTYLRPPPQVTGMFLIDSLLAWDLQVFSSALTHLILPAFVLCFGTMALTMRITRSSMLEVMFQDYIRTARAKGLSERIVLYKHALKNAMIPVMTILGIAYGHLLSGAVLTETIFAWPGLGRYAFNAIQTLDYPAIQGVVLLIAFVFTIANLLVDLSYGVLDPRIRYG